MDSDQQSAVPQLLSPDGKPGSEQQLSGHNRRQLASVETIYPSNFRQVAATLRNIADQIDAAQGPEECLEAVLVTRLADGRYNVHQLGDAALPGRDEASAVFALEAGKAVIMGCVGVTRLGRVFSNE